MNIKDCPIGCLALVGLGCGAVFGFWIFFLFYSIGSSTTTLTEAYADKELVDWANQYHFTDNVDTTDVRKVNMKISETLVSGYEGTGNELSDAHYISYYGQKIYYVSDNQLYDGMIIKDEMIMIGTHRGQFATLPMYCTVKTYRYLLKTGWIKNIKELQNGKID